MKNTSRQPNTRLCRTVWVVTPTSDAAIVIGHDLDAGRQGAVGVDLVDFRLDLGQDVVGVLGAAHHDDGGGDVVVVVAAGDAEARHIADGDLARHP